MSRFYKLENSKTYLESVVQDASQRRAGVEPDLRQHPALARTLLFGPLTSVSFRLCGPDSLPDAADRISAEARALGTVVGPQFSAEELAQLSSPRFSAK